MKKSIQEIYESYVQFCESVGHKAPPFEKWCWESDRLHARGGR